MNNALRILVVDDDDAMRDVIAAGLRQDGYEVHALDNGTGVLGALERFRPDLAILDVRMPGPSGLSVARIVKDHPRDVPVIFVTAADTVEDRLAGFDAGADDYVVKPFAMSEVRARVKAVLRRAGALTSETWSIADLAVDEAARTATRDGNPVDLTRMEFDILVALGRESGRVLTKSQLLATVWGFDEFDPNLVEVHVSALRRKLEAHGPRLVQTVRGVGYVLRA